MRKTVMTLLTAGVLGLPVTNAVAATKTAKAKKKVVTRRFTERRSTQADTASSG
jgi:hypothetical protein